MYRGAAAQLRQSTYPRPLFGNAWRGLLREGIITIGRLARMTSNPRFSPHRQTTWPPARRAALSAEGLTAGIVRGKWLLGQKVLERQFPDVGCGAPMDT